MKRFLFLSLCLLGSAFQAQAQAENYQMFEWEILNIGYTFGNVRGKFTGGLSITSEFRFNATNNISVGIKARGAFLRDMLSGGFFLTGDYNFVDGYKTFRPYGGLQLGYLSGGSLNGGTTIAGYSNSGIAVGPRAGFEYGHARVTAQYAYSFADFVPSYLDASLGLVLWGGEK